LELIFKDSKIYTIIIFSKYNKRRIFKAIKTSLHILACVRVFKIIILPIALFGRANFSHHRGDRGCLKVVCKGGHLNIRERDKQEVGKHCKTRSYTVLTLRQTLLGYRNHRR
jgi:hypothetical protein